MPTATADYLALVHQGRNEWWRYVGGVLVIVLFVEVLGAFPYLLFARGRDPDGLLVFVLLNLGSLIGLAGLATAVRCIHKRSIRSLITPRPRLDWRRVAYGFAVWFVLVAIASAIEALLYPGRYRLTFEPDAFLVYAVVALCLTPLQTTSEELIFRGYAMQGLSLLMRRPVAIAVASSLLFALPHLANPEVAQSPWLVMPQYFLIGLLLALVTLKDGRLELALGVHAANNLFSSLVANYDDSVFTTQAIFTSTMDPAYGLASLVVVSAIAYSVLCHSHLAAEPAEQH